MRIYDQITWIPPFIKSPVVVDATDVIDDSMAGIREHDMDLPWDRFPFIRPPWDKTWIEFRALGEKGGVGLHIIREDTNPIREEQFARDHERNTGAKAPEPFRKAGRTAAHVLNISMYVVGSKPRTVYNDEHGDATALILLDGKGRFIPQGIALAYGPPERNDSVPRATFPTVMWGLMYTLALLNCKNVSTIDHPVPPKVARNRIKRGKPPGVVYKTLVVTLPGTKTTIPVSNRGGGGSEKGRHIVRGHFAHYGEHNKLFGRLTGSFYHPMHVRGRNKKRVVLKDYELERNE